MEGAMDVPMVPMVPMVVAVTTKSYLCYDAERMVQILRSLELSRQWKVEASFNPDDGIPLLVATAAKTEV